MSEPKWLTIARRHLGEREIAGAKSNPVIAGFYRAVNGANLRDEVPWCAAFVGACLGKAGLPDTDSFMARSYLRYGNKLNKPQVGCIVVVWRGKKTASTGHVAFFLREVGGKIEVLGGNQSDSVSIARYAKSRLLGYRWPSDEAVPAPADAVSAHSLRTIQDQLKRLGYREVGRIDGLWGTKTRGAVLAFRADNDLPLNEDWKDAEFIKALFVTASPRTIAPERATADISDLRADGSRVVATADMVKAAGVVTTVGAGAAGTAKETGLLDQLTKAGETAAQVTDAVTTVGAGAAGTAKETGLLDQLTKAGETAAQVTDAVTPLQSLLGLFASYWWVTGYCYRCVPRLAGCTGPQGTPRRLSVWKDELMFGLSKLWLVAGVFAAFVAYTGVVHTKGFNAGAAKIELRVAREVAAEQARQLVIRTEAVDAANAQTLVTMGENDEQDAKIIRLEALLGSSWG